MIDDVKIFMSWVEKLNFELGCSFVLDKIDIILLSFEQFKFKVKNRYLSNFQTVAEFWQNSCNVVKIALLVYIARCQI